MTTRTIQSDDQTWRDGDANEGRVLMVPCLVSSRKGERQVMQRTANSGRTMGSRSNRMTAGTSPFLLHKARVVYAYDCTSNISPGTTDTCSNYANTNTSADIYTHFRREKRIGNTSSCSRGREGAAKEGHHTALHIRSTGG